MADKEQREPAEGKEDGACSNENQHQTKSASSDTNYGEVTRVSLDVIRGPLTSQNVDRLKEDDRNCLLTDQGVTSQQRPDLLNQGFADLQIASKAICTGDKTTKSCHKLFTEFINKELPITPENHDKPKVFVLHANSDEDGALGKDLSKRLNDLGDESCRATSLSEVQALLMMNRCDFIKAAIDWADVVIFFIDDYCLEDIQNIDTSENRSQSSLIIKYDYAVLQDIFVNDASLKKVITVKKEEISNERKIPFELKNPIDIKEFNKIINAVHNLFKGRKSLK